MKLFAHNLYCGWQKKKALLKNLQLSVAGGELICLLGPNGAGKSTLVRTLAGQLTPLQGEVQLALEGSATALQRFSTRERAKHISYLPAEIPYGAGLTLHEMLQLGRYPHQPEPPAQTQNAVAEAANSLHLKELQHVPLQELSDGQRQRAMIARCYVQKAKIQFYDEPLAHLDLHYQSLVLQQLRELTNKGYGILTTAHNPELCLQIADSVWLINSGGEVIAGLAEELLINGQLAKLYAGNAEVLLPRLSLPTWELAFAAAKNLPTDATKYWLTLAAHKWHKRTGYFPPFAEAEWDGQSWLWNNSAFETMSAVAAASMLKR